VPKKQVELAPRREVVKNDFVFYSLRNLEDVQKDRSRHSASKGTQRRWVMGDGREGPAHILIWQGPSSTAFVWMSGGSWGVWIIRLDAWQLLTLVSPIFPLQSSLSSRWTPKSVTRLYHVSCQDYPHIKRWMSSDTHLPRLFIRVSPRDPCKVLRLRSGHSGMLNLHKSSKEVTKKVLQET